MMRKMSKSGKAPPPPPVRTVSLLLSDDFSVSQGSEKPPAVVQPTPVAALESIPEPDATKDGAPAVEPETVTNTASVNAPENPEAADVSINAESDDEGQNDEEQQEKLKPSQPTASSNPSTADQELELYDSTDEEYDDKEENVPALNPTATVSTSTPPKPQAPSSSAGLTRMPHTWHECTLIFSSFLPAARAPMDLSTHDELLCEGMHSIALIHVLFHAMPTRLSDAHQAWSLCQPIQLLPPDCGQVFLFRRELWSRHSLYIQVCISEYGLANPI
jgi:hypothetical protein